ncbi:NUDIX hydrolase [Candidatus Kapabacteria bacterium]|nr:NUDIX hydrolase [Candidatus Kapabacteria bacterium]
MKKFEKISSKVKFKNPWWEYWEDSYNLPNGNIGEYHYVNTHGSTFIIPINSDGKIIMVEQFRYLNSKLSLEFPGGGLPKGMDPKENALKELKEETGFTCNKINQLGVFNPYNGVTNEICYVFVAEQLQIGEQNLEESEELEIKLYSEQEINKMIASNHIWDGMTMAAWSLFVNKKEHS